VYSVSTDISPVNKGKYDKIWLLLFGAMYDYELAVWLVGTQVFWAGVLQRHKAPGSHKNY
jgi:hypothetical protein